MQGVYLSGEYWQTHHDLLVLGRELQHPLYLQAFEVGYSNVLDVDLLDLAISLSPYTVGLLHKCLSDVINPLFEKKHFT